VAQVDGVHLAVVSYSSPADTLARTHEAGAGDRVHWLGPQADVSLALAAADVLVHPTIYDSFGLVVAEAMSHSLPAVVTRNAGVTELLTHRESGWIVQGDPEAGTAAALQELSGNPTLRHEIGVRAREVAAERTWDDVARETLALYEEVAAG
jgi:UDP-glucose:(heptosyl)LPS alpha-1,3-glucosyltransferase